MSSALPGGNATHAAGPKAAAPTAVNSHTTSEPVENVPNHDQLEDRLSDDSLDTNVFTDGKRWSDSNVLHFLLMTPFLFVDSVCHAGCKDGWLSPRMKFILSSTRTFQTRLPIR